MKAVITLIENGAESAIEAQAGELLPSVLRLHGAKLDMPCAGKGTCKSCKVLVDGTERLACQTAIEDGMLVELIRHGELGKVASGAELKNVAKNPMYSGYGVSIDIGTTTICSALLGLNGTICEITRKNPQAAFGADVISRIEKALAGGSDELAFCIRDAITEDIAALSSKAGINSTSIDAVVITGNTAMLYLATGQNPEALSHAPFAADRLFGEYMHSLKLPLAENAKVYLPRCISAFVGGDITTAIVASGICGMNETSLLVDIGTNGELALWHNNRLTCCSTAAGPAFEGAGVSCGVYGIDGAIDHVWRENGEISFSTIGGKPAVGICGSGVIDALAVMLELQIIDETGAFEDDKDFFPITGDIGISAADVRKIQLAKGSVRAGIETLLQASGLDKSDIASLVIAGGFGSYVKLENAAAIGLIPRELLRCSRVIGNAAHTGASMLLQDKDLIYKSVETAKAAHTVALDSNPIFADYYMTCMSFE